MGPEPFLSFLFMIGTDLLTSNQGQDPWICLSDGSRRDANSRTGGGNISELFWLTQTQVERLKPFFPNSRGKPRVDDRKV